MPACATPFEQKDATSVRSSESRNARRASARGEAPVSRDQAPVWPAKGPIPRAGDEYIARDHALRAVESVDGAATAVGDDGALRPQFAK